MSPDRFAARLARDYLSRSFRVEYRDAPASSFACTVSTARSAKDSS